MEQPSGYPRTCFQARFNVDKAEIYVDIVVSPCQLPDRLTAQRYCDFLNTVLLGLLEDVPLAVRQRLRFSTTDLKRTLHNIFGSG
jgi:hypothetical protein